MRKATHLSRIPIHVLAFVILTNYFTFVGIDASSPVDPSSKGTRLKPRPEPPAPQVPSKIAQTCAGTPTPEQLEIEERLFEAMNAARKKNGLPAYTWNEDLAALARDHSCRMVKLGFFSHEDPETGGIRQRLDSNGIAWSSFAENVFKVKDSPDCVESALQDWLESAYHRQNLLSSTYTTTAVGYSDGPDDQCFLTAIFLAQTLVLAVPGQAEPTKCQLNADRVKIMEGDDVELSWTFDGAIKDAKLEAKVASLNVGGGTEVLVRSTKDAGSIKHKPRSKTTYVLTGTGADGKTFRCSVDVEVMHCFITADPDRIAKPGDPVTLTWGVGSKDPISKVRIVDSSGEAKNLDNLQPSGQIVVNPTRPATYTVEWYTRSGTKELKELSCSVPVRVGAEPRCMLSEDTTKATAESVTLRWTTDNGVSGSLVRYEGRTAVRESTFVFAPNGSITLPRPKTRSVYVFTVRNASGEELQCEVPVDSGCALDATPPKVPPPGGKTTLKWNAPGSAPRTVAPKVGPLAEERGTKDVDVTQSTVYTLSRGPAQSCSACVTVIGSGVKGDGSRTLEIPPIKQSLPMWCWLAVSEMIFDFKKVPPPPAPPVVPAHISPFQCTLIALAYPWWCRNGCTGCNLGGGNANNIVNLLKQYPRLLTPARPSVNSTHFRGVLTRQQIKSEIDADHPIIAGISPSGNLKNPPPVPQHVALIVGYTEAADGKLYLIVNDPWPFHQSKGPNPYVLGGGTNNDDGSYCIEYEAFISNLVWHETFWEIR